jgi:diguanylate cyclase (GGDEF)-like protein
MLSGRDWRQMLLDYNSLLLSIGFAGACLAATLFITWLSARNEGFLLSWAAGAALIVANVFVYSRYVDAPAVPLVIAAFALLLTGLSVVFGAAVQFRFGRFPVVVATLAAIAAMLIALPPFALGYDGIGFIITNLAATVLLVATAHQYWRGRAEAPLPIVSLAILYAAVGVSFALCAGVLIFHGALVVGHAPDNWAENLNLVVSIACLSGIGALSLALNQWRAARVHRRDSLTDVQTGLLNRRALFDVYGGGPLAKHTAVIVFDLDDFKSVNDRYGHAAGDQVLMRFAETLRESVRDGDAAARVGGEEFAVVLPRVNLALANLIAERVRVAFGRETLGAGQAEFRCTVSAGVAFAQDDDQSFDKVLRDADGALYMAKRAGRNRVVSPALRLAS